MQPHLYTTEKAKIAFIISLLTGRALQWAETIWTQAGTLHDPWTISSPTFEKYSAPPAVDLQRAFTLNHLPARIRVSVAAAFRGI